MATIDVANGLVNYCKAGDFEAAIKEYYADNIVSVEPMGDPATVTGLEAVLGKLDWFHKAMEIHGFEVVGPFVNGNQFAVRFTLDATNKSDGQRSTLDEIAVYTTESDKIVHEVFLFGR